MSSQPNQHEQNGNQPQIHWEEQHHEDSGQPDIAQQADPRRNPHQHHDQGSVIRWQAAYHIGGIYNGLLTWFDEQMQTSPQQLAAKVTDFIPAEMRLLFNDINFGKKPNSSIKS